MKSRTAKKFLPDHTPPYRKPAPKGETVEQYLARGGTVKKLSPSIANGAIPFNSKWPGGRP